MEVSMTIFRIQYRGWTKFLRGRDSGQALVEAALTMPILLLLLLGAVELGDVAYAAIQVSAAARSGAQYAAMNGGGYMDCNSSGTGTCTSTSGIAQAAAKDALRVSQRSSAFIVTATHGCTCSNGSACSASLACTSPGYPFITVTVQTQASYPIAASVPGLIPGGTVTLHGYSQQLVLQ